MAIFTTIPTRTNADANSAADINALMQNDLHLQGSLGGGSGGSSSPQICGSLQDQINNYVMGTGFYYPQGIANTYTRFAGRIKKACGGSQTIFSLYKNGAVSATLAINVSSTAEATKTISVGAAIGDLLELRITQIGSNTAGGYPCWNIS